MTRPLISSVKPQIRSHKGSERASGKASAKRGRTEAESSLRFRLWAEKKLPPSNERLLRQGSCESCARLRDVWPERNSQVAKERKKAYKMHGALLVFQRHLGSSCRLVKREKRAPLVVRVE